MTERRDINRVLQHCLYLVLSEHYGIEDVLKHYPELADELRPQLETAVWLQDKGKALDPQPDFIATSRQRIVQQIKQEQLTGQSVQQVQEPFWRRASFRLAWRASAALLALLILFLAGNWTINSTRKALPGQTFYPLKLFMERVQIAFPPNADRAAQLHVQFVLRRQSEIEALVRQEKYEYLSYAIQNYQKEVNLAVQALDQLADRDPRRAENLAIILQDSFARQLEIMETLVKEVPDQYLLQINEVMRIAMDSSAQVEFILATKIRPALGIPVPTMTPTPTPTLMPTPSRTLTGTEKTPSPTTTPTASPTKTTTFTPTTSGTLSTQATATPTSTFSFIIPFSPTPKSTDDTGGGGGRKTDTPKPSMTPRPPTNTPLPLKTPTPQPSPTPKVPTPTPPAPTRTPRTPYP